MMLTLLLRSVSACLTVWPPFLANWCTMWTFAPRSSSSSGQDMSWHAATLMQARGGDEEAQFVATRDSCWPTPKVKTGQCFGLRLSNWDQLSLDRLVKSTFGAAGQSSTQDILRRLCCCFHYKKSKCPDYCIIFWGWIIYNYSEAIISFAWRNADRFWLAGRRLLPPLLQGKFCATTSRILQL